MQGLLCHHPHDHRDHHRDHHHPRRDLGRQSVQVDPSFPRQESALEAAEHEDRRQWGIELIVVMCVGQIQCRGKARKVGLRQANDCRTRTGPCWDQALVRTMESLTDMIYSV